MLADKITAKDIMKMLSLTETGTEEIISRRSKAYQRLNRNLDNFTLDELINVIEENRTILRRPIIVDEKRIQVGYNDDDIRKFLPRTFREVKLKADYESIRQHMREAGELA
jgi:regulatory protein spx